MRERKKIRVFYDTQVILKTDCEKRTMEKEYILTLSMSRNGIAVTILQTERGFIQEIYCNS